MNDTSFDYRNELRCLLSERQRRNSRYSLRAMAKDLRISLTALHGVLAGQRHLSKKNLQAVAQRLEWSLDKTEFALATTQTLLDPTEDRLDEDQFRTIADWIHLAILNLARIPKIKMDSIPARLGLTEEECFQAVDRLQRLGLITIDDGYIERCSPSFGTTNDIPSAAIRSFHHNNLIRAQKALDELSVDQRHFMTIAAPSNQKKLKDLKLRIEEFRKEALNILSTPNPDQVYFLNIQAFPVTSLEEV
jgi:uncharacterized protein (TIGR02147 family)